MDERYRHTQVGWVSLACFVPFILLISYFTVKYPHWIAISVLGILVVCLILFASLTVNVDGESIRIKFGPGFIRKTFFVQDLISCQPVKNQWWYGWGLRQIRGGWLYNVSGLQAVELVTVDGKKYRIGTDEPQKLSEVIQQNLRGEAEGRD